MSVRKIAIAAVVIVLGLAASLILLARNWPFSEAAVIQALQDRFARQVQIGAFHKTFFPPGCVAEGVHFLHRKRKDLPPLITMDSLRIRGSYLGLLSIHKSVPG